MTPRERFLETLLFGKPDKVIPSCDHGIPHDVSWENYIEYGRLLAQLTGWL